MMSNFLARLPAVTVLMLVSVAQAADAPVDFARDIQPIFEARCVDCHGAAKQKGGIRLDAPLSLKGGDSGEPLFVKGDPAKSHLLKLVRGDSPDEIMPPKGDKLSPQQIDTLTRWIQQGGDWPATGEVAKATLKHWSFNAPVRPEVPQLVIGTTSNPIDNFILHRLAKEGLRQSPEADKHALIRRVTFALTGLPPTPAEIEVFLSDTAAGAYERLVDRLLVSPAFGERWARPWLDIARYADSAGYGSDPLRFTIHRYRDWLIDAYNSNKPYDQFVIEQLAGDLLPKATTDQLIATAFHRNTMTNTEGGTDDEEFRIAAVKDRTDVTIQAFMGLTMGCAQCHTHKFDPITHKDYYSVFAIFNQTADGDRADETPTIATPSPEELKEKAKIEAQIAALQKEFEKQTKVTESVSISPDAVVVAPAASPTKVKAASPAAKPAAEKEVAEPPLPEPEAIKTLKKIEDLKKKLNTIGSKTAVMQELPKEKQRSNHILVKGNFLNKGDKVEPAVLEALNPLPPGANADRLGLAKWIVAKENPLTARVAVNRFWSQFFGAGLVETQEDFGEMGTPPSHPELLDWLAVEFMEPTVGESRKPWDMKRLMRLIVTSQTFRQSAKVEPQHLEKDADNRFLARMPRQRLEAEMVRDQALAVSGLLSRKMFGPSIYPPQPDGLWQAAFNGQRSYPVSQGEDRYRRGVYVFWRRTVPYPSMQTFDAPSREVCTIRRIHTSTPLQAFVTLNDPVYVECSQVLARRLVKEGGESVEARIRFGLELVLQRPAMPEQIKPLIALYETELAHYKQQAEEAKKLATPVAGSLPKDLDVPQAAAWTVVANVMLNLDGAMTR